MALSQAVIAYESEESAKQRLQDFGYAPGIAAEVAVYLAQSTDLPHFVDDIAVALRKAGVRVEFTPVEDLAQRLAALKPKRNETIVWAMTDGVRYYRGSAVPALARLEGFARFGSPPTAAHLCQDKFASLALASAAGIPTPPTRLMEGGAEVGVLGSWENGPGPLFVKPNTLGAKIGIFADSLCEDLSEARERSRGIWDRYSDRALIQPFIEGDDVRVSFMDLGGDLVSQLGIERIAKNPASETGGVFLTMKDNETLSGAKDTAGARGGFGAERAAAFVPQMVDLRRETDARSRMAVARIIEAAERLARLVTLRDCFSMDFRIDSSGLPTFFEFEVCPAVTIYDFQNYLAGRGYSLGAALASAMTIAFERSRAAAEA